MNPRTATARPRALTRIVAPVVALGLLLAGCTGTGDRLADDYRNGTGEGYISGDGLIVQPPAEERGDPVAFSGTLENGESFSSADHAGEIVVVNFWFAACPPCREEAEHLQGVASAYADQGVTFVGVNTGDTDAVARSFAKEHGVEYTSIIDFQDNGVQSAFATSPLPPISTPTTLVLDAQGRVAARISGPISGSSPLDDIIDELLAES